jgi:hypothetical protein
MVLKDFPEQAGWHRPLRSVFCAVAVVLAVTVIASGPLTHTAAAAERALSDEQKRKIDGWIAQDGRETPMNKMVTDILGLTKNDETISPRAYVVKGTEDASEIHQIEILPRNQGYLVGHAHQDKLEIYWTDNDLVLISTAAGTRGGHGEQMSFADAQRELGKELGFWAKFADTH